jgi:hypothetical protein
VTWCGRLWMVSVEPQPWEYAALGGVDAIREAGICLVADLPGI